MKQQGKLVFQSLLYIAACLLPNALLLVNYSLNFYIPVHQENVRFAVAFMVKLIVPLQRMFNFIIYVRPRYIMLRQKKGKSLSFFSIVSEIVFGAKYRPLEANADQHADDFAPELLAVPGVDNSNGRSESNNFSGTGNGVGKDSSRQDFENACPDTEEGCHNVGYQPRPTVSH